jgi:hypothetical protein
MRLTYNMASVVKSGLAAALGAAMERETISGYYLAGELAAACQGMMIAVRGREWARHFACLTPAELAHILQAAVARLRKQLGIALARIAELEREIASLKKNFATSSKPPSSDIVKPPRPVPPGGKRRKRRGGGQPGHKRHTRPPFPPEQVDQTCVYEWTTVPAGWKPLRRFRVVQQVELVEKPYRVNEHRARRYRNLHTGQVRAARLPEEVRRGGLLGPRLTALVAYPKGACHVSVETIRRFFADVRGLPISHGQVVQTVPKASAAPGREVPHHPAGPGDAALRPPPAGEDQGAVPRVAPPPGDARGAVAACRRTGPPRAVGRGTEGAGAG